MRRYLFLVLFLVPSILAHSTVTKVYEPGILKTINVDAKEEFVPRTFNINGTEYHTTSREVSTTRVFVIKGNKFIYETTPLKKFSATEFIEGASVKFRVDEKKNRLFLQTKKGKDLPTLLLKVSPFR